jgi:hypothetical protein
VTEFEDAQLRELGQATEQTDAGVAGQLCGWCTARLMLPYRLLAAAAPSTATRPRLASGIEPAVLDAGGCSVALQSGGPRRLLSNRFVPSLREEPLLLLLPDTEKWWG